MGQAVASDLRVWTFGSALRVAPLLPALVNAIVILTTWPMPTGGAPVRALHLLSTTSELLCLGLVAGALADGAARLVGERRWIARAVLFALGAGGALLLLEEDTLQLGDALRAGVVAGVALAATVVPDVRRACDRWLAARLAALAAAVALAIANHFTLRINYPGAHLGMGLGAVVAAGAALAGLPRPGVLPLVARLSALGAACLLAASSLALAPAATVAVEIIRDESAPFYRFVAPLRGPRYAASLAAVPEDMQPWFRSRTDAPEVAPTEGRPELAAPLVILLSIDALRYDTWADPANARLFPHLKRLAGQAVEFEHAHSAGSTTVASVASMLSGLYYSQRYWTRTNFLGKNRTFLTRDTARGLCDYLRDRGVVAATAVATDGLKPEYGIVRGCAPLGPDFTGNRMSATLIPLVKAFAEGLGPEQSGFVYAHLLDPHEPYDLGGTHGAPRERQLREIALADAQVGALVEALKRTGLWKRTVVIVTADHGESFGDHGAQFHGGNVYEELTRVPLIIRIPGVRARRVPDPAGGIDITPTVLDLFGVPTPGHLMGQSLLPLAMGRDVRLTRPIVLDSAKHQRALFFPDGVKVIHAARESSFEMYDLTTDPLEADNLVERAPDADARIGALLAFFDAHTYRKLGYRIPSR